MAGESKSDCGNVSKFFGNYGFIKRGKNSYFFHKSQLECRVELLSEGDSVTFEIGSHNGRTVAINVKIAGDKLVKMQEAQEKRFAEERRAKEERDAELQRVIEASNDEIRGVTVPTWMDVKNDIYASILPERKTMKNKITFLMSKLLRGNYVWKMNEKVWLRPIIIPVLVANDGNVDKSFDFIKSLNAYEARYLAGQVEPMGMNQSSLEFAKMRAINILKDESKSEQKRVKLSKQSLFSDFQKIGRSSCDLKIINDCHNHLWNEQFIRDF